MDVAVISASGEFVAGMLVASAVGFLGIVGDAVAGVQDTRKTVSKIKLNTNCLMR